MELADSSRFRLNVRIRQQRFETSSFHVFRNVDSRDTASCGAKIHEFDHGIALPPSGRHSRDTHQHGNLSVDIAVSLLAPTAMLPPFPTVIFPHNDKRTFVEPQISGPVDRCSNTSIHETNRGIVPVFQPSRGLLGRNCNKRSSHVLQVGASSQFAGIRSMNPYGPASLDTLAARPPGSKYQHQRSARAHRRCSICREIATWAGASTCSLRRDLARGKHVTSLLLPRARESTAILTIIGCAARLPSYPFHCAEMGTSAEVDEPARLHATRLLRGSGLAVQLDQLP